MPLILGPELEPACYMSFDAYSDAHRVNIILPGTGPRGEGNHFYLPAYGKRDAYIGRCMVEAIRDEAHAYRRRGRMAGTVANPLPAENVFGPGTAWASRLDAETDGSKILDRCRITVTPVYGARGMYRVTLAIF